MMTSYDSFNMVLNQFGETLGAELALKDGKCIFTVDGNIDVVIDYYDEADVVVAWSAVGIASEDEYQAERARALFALNELDAPNGGFSVSMDPETRLVIVQDHRPVELFDSADRLAAWVEALVDLVNLIRDTFEEKFPCSDMLLDEEDEEDDEEEEGEEA